MKLSQDIRETLDIWLESQSKVEKIKWESRSDFSNNMSSLFQLFFTKNPEVLKEPYYRTDDFVSQVTEYLIEQDPNNIPFNKDANLPKLTKEEQEYVEKISPYLEIAKNDLRDRNWKEDWDQETFNENFAIYIAFVADQVTSNLDRDHKYQLLMRILKQRLLDN